MIPLYRTTKPERAANLLAQNYRRVLVNAFYYCIPTLRFRADLIDGRVYFDKVPSQIVAWQNTGGVLMHFKKDVEVGACEAILFAECPRTVEFLDLLSQDVLEIAVVREPPTWQVHLDSVKRNHADKPERLQRKAMDNLQRVRQLVDSSARLTPASLAHLLHSQRKATPQPSFAPASPASEARSSGTTRAVP